MPRRALRKEAARKPGAVAVAVKTLSGTQEADLKDIAVPLLAFPLLIIFRGGLVCGAIAGTKILDISLCCTPAPLHLCNYR